MIGIRKRMSAGAAGCVAIGALLVIASAPAASGRLERSSPFLTEGARSSRIQVFELPRSGMSQHAATGFAKLDRRLSGLARGANVSAYSSRLRASGFSRTSDGKVRVIVEARDPAEVRAAVAQSGGRVERSWRNLVQAVVSPGSLGSLSRDSAIAGIRAPAARVEQAVTGEEVGLDLAASWHTKGFTGKGVKIAVIDGGFAGLAQRQAEGELPTNVVTQDDCEGAFSTATEHGTAVAEIVHEMAPDAQLYLICINTEVDLASAEAYAKSQGVQIINHSVGWYGPWRGDGTGPIGAVVADARASGILWVNAAGNDATTHWSGTYRDANGDGFHEWNPNGDEGNSFIWPNGSEICGFLTWDEWPNARSDFDLGLFLSGSNSLLFASTMDQNGSQPPFEALCAKQDTGSDLVVFWAIRGYRVVSTPRLDLFSLSPSLQYQTAAGSIVDPANSPAALAVGALCWQSRQLEFYSSQGPTIDGRTKPDIVGHDSVSGATYGAYSGCPSAFAGTSAASPEVAGAAALVKQAYPSYGPDQLQSYLVKHARDLGTPGPDDATGAGELLLPAAPDVVAPSAKALPGAGHAGSLVKLVSRVSDDSGQVLVVEQVKRGGHVIATLGRSGFVAASGPTMVSASWKAPAGSKGAYQHCVTATDHAGNVSPASCAPIRLR
jgi:subtilisin family serine protease